MLQYLIGQYLFAAWCKNMSKILLLFLTFPSSANCCTKKLEDTVFPAPLSPLIKQHWIERNECVFLVFSRSTFLIHYFDSDCSSFT